MMGTGIPGVPIPHGGDGGRRRKRKKKRGFFAELIGCVKALLATALILCVFFGVTQLAIPEFLGFSEEDKARISGANGLFDIINEYKSALDHKNGVYRGSVRISHDGKSVTFDTVNGDVTTITGEGYASVEEMQKDAAGGETLMGLIDRLNELRQSGVKITSDVIARTVDEYGNGGGTDE